MVFLAEPRRELSLVHLPALGAWQAKARCRSAPGLLFFPERGDSSAQAKAICGRCLVRAECLAYAVPLPELQGIWGGTTPIERREMRKAVPVPVREPGPPKRRKTPSPRGTLHRRLEFVASHPGRWARVAEFPSGHSAQAMASLLRTGRRSVPPGRWEFEGRRCDGGSELYARVETAAADA